MRAITDPELRPHVDPRGFEHGHFLGQSRQVHHHAVANHRGHTGAQNSAGNQLENELFFADKYGMAGIVPALIPRHDIEAFGQEIDYFTFALVTPLGAQDDHVIHFLIVHNGLRVLQRTIVAMKYSKSITMPSGYNGSDAAFRHFSPARRGEL